MYFRVHLAFDLSGPAARRLLNVSGQWRRVWTACTAHTRVMFLWVLWIFPLTVAVDHSKEQQDLADVRDQFDFLQIDSLPSRRR